MFKNGAFERTSAAKPFGFPALPLPLAVVVAVAALSTPVFAQEGIKTFGYFTNAQMTGVPDATMSVVNPGAVAGFSPAGDLCANIYVFAPNQQIIECCSCLITPDGLRTFSVNNDVTNNPLTAAPQHSGDIKIVSAAAPASGVCSTTVPGPAGSFTSSVAETAYVPSGLLGAWITHVNDDGNGTFSVSETNFYAGPIAASELGKLQRECKFIELNGSAHGICTCGTE